MVNCPTIVDTTSPSYNNDSVTLYYILSSAPAHTSGTLTVELNNEVKTVDWNTGNSYGASIPITFNGLLPNTNYTVSSQSFTADSIDGCSDIAITNESAVYGTIRLPPQYPSVPSNCLYSDWESWRKCKDRTQSRIKKLLSGDYGCPVAQYEERGCGFNWKVFFLIMFTVSIGLLIKIYRS
jgi:hypothetical protein